MGRERSGRLGRCPLGVQLSPCPICHPCWAPILRRRSERATLACPRIRWPISSAQRSSRSRERSGGRCPAANL